MPRAGRDGQNLRGGRETNKHADKKLRAGRGTVGKTPLVGLKNRPGNAIRVAVVPDNRQATLQAFVRAHLQPGARLYTDEAAAYQGLSDYRHARVHHGGGECGRGPVHTNGIESFRALCQRGFRGTYHSMSPKHLHRYAREFEGRHNHQADGDWQHMACLVQGMEGRRLTYGELISDWTALSCASSSASFKGCADAPKQLAWPAKTLAGKPAGRIPMTHKAPRLHATPQALARAVVRTRPHLGPERIKVFEDEAEAGRKARDLARAFPQVEVVPCGTGHAVLADGCPYLTNGRGSLQPMPTG